MSEPARLDACLDIRDHIVDLYSDAYLANNGGEALPPAERVAFRDGWADELARRGTFARFEETCFLSLTPRKYECGMASQTADSLVACMKLEAP